MPTPGVGGDSECTSEGSLQRTSRPERDGVFVQRPLHLLFPKKESSFLRGTVGRSVLRVQERLPFRAVLCSEGRTKDKLWLMTFTTENKILASRWGAGLHHSHWMASGMRLPHAHACSGSGAPPRAAAGQGSARAEQGLLPILSLQPRSAA